MNTEDVGTLRVKAQLWDEFVGALRRQVEADLPVQDLGRHLLAWRERAFPGQTDLDDTVILQAWNALETHPGAWEERLGDDKVEIALGSLSVAYHPRQLTGADEVARERELGVRIAEKVDF